MINVHSLDKYTGIDNRYIENTNNKNIFFVMMASFSEENEDNIIFLEIQLQ